MTKINFYILLFISGIIFGQQKEIEVTIDSSKIKMGSQFHITLKTTIDSLSSVIFPEEKNFGNLEVLESYSIDTIKKDNKYELIKKYGLTQFDSGHYTIPSLRVLINNKAYFSDSLSIEVSNVVVDTLKQQLYEIKPIVEVPSIQKAFWQNIILPIVIILLIALVFVLLKKYKKKKEETTISSTPIEKAHQMLLNLEKKELWQKGEIKSYYSELTNIARNYIEEVIEIPAMESTTSELIQGLQMAVVKKKMVLSLETLENLESVLKKADLVKFAKSKPMDFEIATDKNKIERVITILDESIPDLTAVTAEEEKLYEIKKLAERKKQNKIIAISVSSLLVVLICIYFIISYGWENIKDGVLGNNTKELLLDTAWVRSEYGNPAVSIETPKVLTRYINEEKQQVSGATQNQRFLYGSLLEDLYVSIETSRFEKKNETSEENNISNETNNTLDGVMNEMIKIFEMQLSAKNIIVKQGNFTTQGGIEGKKAYGTMIIFDPINKKDVKMAYQILIFMQKTGLQEIIITHKEKDAYAVQIANRIINSIELNKINE